MMKARHIASLASATARALLGALLFLLLASYLAIPCMARDSSQFQDVGAPNSCNEHHLFKPQADLKELFGTLAPENPFRLPIILASVALPFALSLALIPAAHDRLRRRRRPRGARLPFASADPPKLPYLSAQRDA